MNFSDSRETTKLYNEPLSELSQQFLTQEIQGFDYTILTREVRVLVQSKTSELKSLMRRSTEDIIEIGQKLIDVKQQLGHGNFSDWLKAEFDWSVRTAARFMQVAIQFKFAKLANLNIAVSALYLLAQPSTPEKARKQALELANEGKNITHTKAKKIIDHYKELAQPSVLNSATTDMSTQTIGGNSSSSLETQLSRQTHEQPEAKSVAIKLSVKTVPTIEWDKKLGQKADEKIDELVPQKDSEIADGLQSEPSNHIRVLRIEHEKPELLTNIFQTFELTFAGIHVDFEGDPKALIIILEQMQNNPVFTENVLQQVRSLAGEV